MQTTRSLVSNIPMLDRIERRHNATQLDNAYEAFLSRHTGMTDVVRHLASNRIFARLDPGRVENSRRVNIAFEHAELSVLRSNHQSIDLFVWLMNRHTYPPDYVAKRYGIDIEAEFQTMIEKYIAQVARPIPTGNITDAPGYIIMVTVPEPRYRIKDDRATKDTADMIVGALLDNSPALKWSAPYPDLSVTVW